ncbi:MAG: hypothetical protein IKN71_03755 [Alphaproteobacteria bacterium]|nr:hypothetical protein [Alphaproteobacteria bacterium]
MEQQQWYPNDVNPYFFEDVTKVEELYQLLRDARNMVHPDDEKYLFKPGYEKALFEYLRHHSLHEANQWLLFVPENEKVLLFFIENWVLGSIYEAKLFEPEFRARYLMKYIEFHNFADHDNEMLLWGEGMREYRRFYINQTEFHVREAELELLKPQNAEDLQIYVKNKRRFFRDVEPKFREQAAPEIVAMYDFYHQKKD